MTPKEKAIELVNKYYHKIEHTISNDYKKVTKEITKECALIAVDEILNYQSQLLENYKVELKDTYWEQVKQEIEKLK